MKIGSIGGRAVIITDAGHIDIADPMFQAILAELGLLALIILLMAWAMRLIREPRSVP